MFIEKRQYCGYYGYGYCGNSAWYNWGRWVLLGVLVGVVLLIFFMTSCINARRRRSRGQTPLYGTGFLAPQQAEMGNNYYGPNGANSAAPPYSATAPPYQQPTNEYYGQQNGAANNYYSYGQQSGVEMAPVQQPANTYQPQTGGQPVYAPPAGPPPAKKGDIVR